MNKEVPHPRQLIIPDESKESKAEDNLGGGTILNIPANFNPEHLEVLKTLIAHAEQQDKRASAAKVEPIAMPTPADETVKKVCRDYADVEKFGYEHVYEIIRALCHDAESIRPLNGHARRAYVVEVSKRLSSELAKTNKNLSTGARGLFEALTLLANPEFVGATVDSVLLLANGADKLSKKLRKSGLCC